MQLKKNAELIENYWHFGCHVDELREEGDYLLYNLDGLDVAIYHDGKEIIAFDNRCPHRGTKFFDTSHGSMKAVCKYHGWSFTGGKLIIPIEEELLADLCNKPTLNRFQTDLCGTFLFFAIRPNISILEQLGEELFSIIESISFDCTKRRDLNQYLYECPWQVSIENALEPEHLPYVHSNTLNKLALTNCRNRFWGLNSGVYFDIGDTASNKGLQRLGRFYDRGNHMHPGYMSIYLFPFSFISSTAGTSYSIQSFFPKSNEETWFTSRLYSVILSDPRHQGADQMLINAAIDMNHRVFQEDHDICKRINRESWLRSLSGPLYKSEEKVLAFRRQLFTTVCQ